MLKFIVNSGISIAASLLVALPAEAAIPCGIHDDAGIPFESDQLICHDGFFIGYNYSNKVADWVMYTMTEASVTPKFERPSSFTEDYEITFQYRAQDSDYVRSNYDRGHLAPNASMDFSKKAQLESFMFSNIAPQHPQLNRQAWAELEGHLRDCAIDAKNGIMVVTGPVWNANDIQYIGNFVRLPYGFYSVAIERTKPYRTAAWFMKNAPAPKGQLSKYRVTVDQVEQAVGFDFFPRIPDDKESINESSLNGICE